MSEVKLRGIEKIYANGFHAIHGIDLDIADGELAVLVGPSGCGKSTLLRMVAGLETVTSGEIRIGDSRVNDLEPAKRNIAMVFQNYALYPHMSCYGNMAYGLRNRRTPKDEIERRVRAAARILEIEHLLDRKPRQLSGGQRQRVAMGRAIVREPAAFLFDEPLSNLDAKLRVQMRLEIKRLQRSLATTSIYVTHDQVEAMTLADRLVVMNEGAADQIGAPLEVYERPRTRFVAGFIGSPAMNFIPCTLVASGRAVRLDGAVELALEAPVVTASEDRPALLGIRPEHLSIDPRGSLGLRVDLAEPLGAETLLHGEIEAGDTPITVRVAGNPKIHSEDRITLNIAPDKVHLFDPDDGVRIE